MRFLNFLKHQNLKLKTLSAAKFVKTTKRNKNFGDLPSLWIFMVLKSGKSFPALWMFPDLQLIAHKQRIKANPWLKNSILGDLYELFWLQNKTRSRAEE